MREILHVGAARMLYKMRFFNVNHLLLLEEKKDIYG